MSNKHSRIIDIIFLVIIVAVAALALVSSFNATREADSSTLESTEESPYLIDEPVLFKEIVSYRFETESQISNFIAVAEEAVRVLNNEIATRDKYTQSALDAMCVELKRIYTDLDGANNQLRIMNIWKTKEEQYPYATKTWKYLKNLGYSDVACAGILGNLMAECGGHTLNLNPYLYDRTGSYYGMFQWSVVYYPAAKDMTFEEQLDYYASTSLPIFKTWGKEYEKDFTIEDFNNLSDPRQTALAFAKVYERCSSWTYERRQDFAEVAYQYFVLDFEVS